MRLDQLCPRQFRLIVLSSGLPFSTASEKQFVLSSYRLEGELVDPLNGNLSYRLIVWRGHFLIRLIVWFSNLIPACADNVHIYINKTKIHKGPFRP